MLLPPHRSSRRISLGISVCLACVAAVGCSKKPDEKARSAGAENQGVDLPAAAALRAPEIAPASRVRVIEASGQLGPGRGTLVIDLKPPPGAKLTAGAPVVVEGKNGKNAMGLVFPERFKTKLDPERLPLHVPVTVADGALGPALIDLSYYYCSGGDDGSCVPERAKVEVKLDLSGASEGGEAYFTYAPSEA